MAEKSVVMSAGETEDGASTGIIRWEIDNFSEVGEDIRYSPDIEVHGILWYISVSTEREDDGSFSLWPSLHGIHNESTMWSIDVSAEFVLFNKDNSKNVKDEWSKKFNHSVTGWGNPKFIECNTLIGEDEGFINDDKILIEVRFTLRNIKGIRKFPRFDFSDPNKHRHDITLVIEEKKVYVSKQYLSLHSPYFDALFFGEFAEKHKDEIVLKDVDYEGFIEMLNMIYPSGMKITDDNAERLLSLGDRFQIEIILDKAEKFLIESTKLNVAAKLKISGQYRLVQLQGACLEMLTTISDVINLKETEEYEDFSDATKISMLEKIIKLGN